MWPLVFPGGKISIVRRLFWSEEVDRAVAEINQQLSTRCGGQPGIAVLDLGKVLADDHSAAPLVESYRDALHLKPEAYQKLPVALLPLLERSPPTTKQSSN